MPGADIDLVRYVAVCRPCGEIVSLADIGGARAGMERANAGTLGATTFRPSDLSWLEEESAGHWMATMTPSRLKAIPLLGFALVWDSFLVFWYAAAIAGVSSGGGANGGAWMMLLFPLIHVGAGVFITWTALRGLLNRTVLVLDQGTFTRRSGPIADFRTVTRPMASLAGFTTIPTGGKTQGLDVAVNTKDGQQVALRLDLPPVHAQFVAEQLQRRFEESRTPLGYR